MNELIEITIPADSIELTLSDTILVSIEKDADVVIDVAPMGVQGPQGSQGPMGIPGPQGSPGGNITTDVNGNVVFDGGFF